MLHLEEDIFQKKKVNVSKLISFGFIKKDNQYEYTEYFMNQSFKAIILYQGKISGKVVDTMTDEEYMPLRVEAYDGEYVNQVRNAYRKILKNIAEQCFDSEYFVSNQANRITQKIYNIYSVTPDFPWKEEHGVFRHKENKKWFGLVMHVKWNALLNNKDQKGVDIINVKKDVSRETKYQQPGVFPGYHMNHKLWVSVVLDDTLSDEKILDLVQISFDKTK